MWDPEILCENNINIETASLHFLRTVAGFTLGGQWKKEDIEGGGIIIIIIIMVN
jgi:hypothetical protein